MIDSLFDYLIDLLAGIRDGVANWGRRIGMYGAELGRWVNRNRTDLLHIFTALVVALLLLGAINQQNASRHAAENSNQIIRGNTTIIKNQSKQIAEQKAEIAALSSHVDCLFVLATNPNHSAYIANPANCLIAAPAATSKPSATPAPTSSPPPPSNTNSGQTGATTTPSQTDNSTPVTKPCARKILFVCV